MAGFNNIYITTAGAQLAAKTIVGKKLQFTVAKVGSGTLSDSSMSAIKARTSLVNPVMSIDITRVEQTSQTQATIGFVFKNTDAPSAFYFRELGIFALDPDTKQEILFAYAYAGNNAEYVNNSISEIVQKKINVVVTVDNASNVQITLDSSQIYVTEDELETALANAKLYSGKNYGIKRLITDNTIASWTRIGDAEGLKANATKNGSEVANDFDNCYPWSDIRRCNVDPVTGQVLAYYGETGYKADGSNGEVMVKIPEFWWKRERVPDEFGNVYEYIYIADYARAGYKKSEEFFVGAYLLSTTDEEGTIVAHSKSGVIPRYSTTLANFRSYAKNTGDGFCLLDYHYFLLQMLYLVEYANFNSQSMLGNGLVAYSGNGGKALIAENSTNRIIIASVNSGLWVGKTVCIGATDAWNSSVAADREITSIEDYNDGQITGKVIHFDGDPVDIALGNVIWGSAQKTGENDVLGNKSGCLNNNQYHPVSYRGIEDIFGHLFQHVDGINIKDFQAYICKNPSEYANDKFDAPYEKLGYINSETVDSFSKKLGLDEKHPEIALPIEVGASSSTGTTDYYWGATGNKIASLGGYFRGSGAKAGFFCWYCSLASSGSYWYCGARLLKYQ